MSVQREWRIGAHELRFEPPDTLWMKIQGETTREDSVQLLEVYRELGEQQPIFVVTDLRGATSLDKQGQRYVSEHIRLEWFQSAIYIGARLVHKAAVKALAFLDTLNGRGDESLLRKFRFVSTEDEARELIHQLRAKQYRKVA